MNVCIKIGGRRTGGIPVTSCVSFIITVSNERNGAHFLMISNFQFHQVLTISFVLIYST